MVHSSSSTRTWRLMIEGIAFYGGSFNPPTIAHKAIIKYLLNLNLKKVILKPCGSRRDKEDLFDQQKRRILRIQKELTFDHPTYQLDLTGITQPMRPTILEWDDLIAKHPEQKIWLVIGTDLLEDEGQGLCQIQRWFKGEELFQNADFLIFPRPSKKPLILPPHYFEVKDFEPINVSSTQLRSIERTLPDTSRTSHGR